jgi:hypothetical protein
MHYTGADEIFVICYMISTVICCAIELSDYLKRKLGNLVGK